MASRSLLRAKGRHPDRNEDGVFRACAASANMLVSGPSQPFRPTPTRRAPMLARTDTVATISESWLAQFEGALAAPDRARLKTLFHSDSHWRDVLALTWHIKTVNSSDAISREMATHAARARP